MLQRNIHFSKEDKLSRTNEKGYKPEIVCKRGAQPYKCQSTGTFFLSQKVIHIEVYNTENNIKKHIKLVLGSYREPSGCEQFRNQPNECIIHLSRE